MSEGPAVWVFSFIVLPSSLWLMPIIIKTRREIEMMRRAGQAGCEILAKMREAVAPGVSTQELNEIARRELARVGAVGLSKNYPTYKPGEGFPAETCISVNEEVVHGIPGSRQLREGDIVTLDLALMLDGYCADTATTVPVGRISPEVQKLLDVTRQTLALALNNIRPGRRWTEIARLMQYHVESNGFSVVREFVGHGIGRSMHEDPKVANFVTAEQLRGDFKLRPGMTLAVEPMVVMGSREVDLLPDNWTVVTKDGLPAAHFEHTIAVTENGVDILTDGRPPWGL
ncbi:MAG TPA: type I methionyl aminopeptidase [Tepidisphaeraceae bacterium]|nr:type I methionyl aminopeptidase [Tepidisphaeraceae bacterium]